MKKKIFFCLIALLIFVLAVKAKETDSINVLKSETLKNTANQTDKTKQEKFKEIKATKELINSLKKGGFVIYMRHGKTDTNKKDIYPIDLTACSKQRPLNEEGRRELYLIRNYIKQAKIPFYKIYHSQLCRAKETAEIVFGKKYINPEKNLIYTAQLTSEEKIPVIAKTRELLSKPLTNPKSNRILVAHAPNLADLMDYFPEREASIIIFKPLDNGDFEYIATIQPDEWKDLLKK